MSALVFALSIVLSAFLLFEVQPLMAKLILPWFGGTAAVWTTCMLFFQAALLAGYAYAHWLTGLPGRRQAAVHCALLAVSLLALPIFPSGRWKPEGGADPLAGMLGLLTVTIGLPYFLLASTSPLLQAWYSRARGGGMPWRFFALSNAGSMAGLLAFPFLIEPWLTGHVQVWTWSVAYTVFALLCALVAIRSGRLEPAAREDPGPTAQDGEALTESGRLAQPLVWVGLAACASALLLALTSHISQTIAAIPLLWVLPLSLYLLSFILCFESDRWYRRPMFAVLGAAGLIALGYGAMVGTGDTAIWNAKTWTGFLCAAAFCVFMLCHGELARRRPPPARLTSFYLMVATGGAAGGLFVGVAAPFLFRGLYDLAVVVTATSFFFALLIFRDRWALASNGHPPEAAPGDGERAEPGSPRMLQTPQDWPVLALLLLLPCLWVALRLTAEPNTFPGGWLAARNDMAGPGAAMLPLLYLLWRGGRSRKAAAATGILALLVASAVGGILVRETLIWTRGARLLARNLYGVSMINDEPTVGNLGLARTLFHGTIVHGIQFLHPKYQRYPTTYYAPRSGIGLAIRAVNESGPAYIGTIGLGAGTIAAYGRAGDRYRFYDINPLVAKIAAEQFTFLSGSPAAHDVVLGDARLSLENEPPQHFDLLAVDAFSGDSIPVHLLTREAMQLYWRHLKPDGVLAVHVSNKYLTLAPVVLLPSFENGKVVRLISSRRSAMGEIGSDWVLVASRDNFFERPEIAAVAQVVEPIAGLSTWTDDYSNLFRILQ